MENLMKYFLTVDRCNVGRRGLFCDHLGRCFSKDDLPHTAEEMIDILGPFWLILSPASSVYSAETFPTDVLYTPLGEYSNCYGIAVPKEVTDGTIEGAGTPPDTGQPADGD